MAINLEMVGYEYPKSQPLVVTVSDIQNFCVAIGDRKPDYKSDLVATPTFVISLIMQAMTFAMNDPKLNMDYARVVHADQKFDYNRPIFAGDVLTVRMRIADIRQKMGSDFVTFETQVLDQSQQLLATTTSLLIVRGTDGAA